jgi:hypothetical protein
VLGEQETWLLESALASSYFERRLKLFFLRRVGIAFQAGSSNLIWGTD